jgi:V8-like Glu-specific endopeptidase
LKVACEFMKLGTSGYAILFTLALVVAAPATAVIILDSTWAEEGGDEDDPAAGFGAAIELADQPQFDALVALASSGGNWGECSGTWIGNHAGRGYVLTAAHCFSEEAPAEDFRVRSRGGDEFTVIDSVIHEDWVDTDSTTGYDVAILVLDSPVRDAGRPPTLYGGNDERGRLLTFMGYGSRGIASIGQHDDYHDGESTPAGAQGLVDVVKSDGDDEDTGNYLGVFLPAEDDSIENPYGGATMPGSRLAGLLGSGDSGGPAWLKLDGRWVVAGVNSNGSGNAEAGQTSWFVRVSGKREWILAHAPMARFAP